jgi:hypothetical protein
LKLPARWAREQQRRIELDNRGGLGRATLRLRSFVESFESKRDIRSWASLDLSTLPAKNRSGGIAIV